MTAPWLIVSVEPRDGRWVRITHTDGLAADHDFAFLLSRDGAFSALTAEMISGAQLVDGETVGWLLPDGTVLDLAPDALYQHACGHCPGTCRGWTAAMTVLLRHGTGEQ